MRRQGKQRIDTCVLVGTNRCACSRRYLPTSGPGGPARPHRLRHGTHRRLAANGKRSVTMEIWRDDVNKAGGLCGDRWSSSTTTIRASGDRPRHLYEAARCR